MGSGPVCICEKPKKEKIKNWVVIHYKCNYSAFSGYHRTPSDYSAIMCLECGYIWRTKAEYVESLKHMSWEKAYNEVQTRRKS